MRPSSLSPNVFNRTPRFGTKPAKAAENRLKDMFNGESDSEVKKNQTAMRTSKKQLWDSYVGRKKHELVTCSSSDDQETTLNKIVGQHKKKGYIQVPSANSNTIRLIHEKNDDGWVMAQFEAEKLKYAGNDEAIGNAFERLVLKKPVVTLGYDRKIVKVATQPDSFDIGIQRKRIKKTKRQIEGEKVPKKSEGVL